MKSLNATLISIALLLCISHYAIGQDSLSLKLIGRAYPDSIALRWAPPTPVAWKLLNQYGYRLERYTIMRDSIVLEDKPMKVLQEVIKVAPAQTWQKYINYDDNIAIAAQAIFGEDFETSNKKQTDMMEVVQKTREIEMRYSFTLLAADVSPLAASLAGLWFVDKDVKKNEKYLYRIHSLAPQNIEKLNFGYVYLGTDDAMELPVPSTPELKREEKKIMLKWDTYTYLDTYTAYFVEKSIDGGVTFSRLTPKPIVNIISQADLVNGNSFSAKTDSVSENVSQIVYVIRGMTPFGEIGPPSAKVNVSGEKPLAVNPTIVKTNVINNAKVELEWTFSQQHEIEIKGFHVERKEKLEDAFQPVTSVGGRDRKYVDDKPLATNYYRVVAFTPKGQRSVSFPHLVQLIDSIPPSAPQRPVAKIDSVGRVMLTWAPNTEPDLIGYRVYRSNFKNSEFGQITVSPVGETTFLDTVNIKTLNKKIWYKVTAVDNRFNTSPFSDFIEVVLPDVIPPVPPVVKSIRSKEKGVEIIWSASSSEDVEAHEVYRKHQYSTSWQLIKRFTKADSCCYFFDEVSSGHKYHYSFLAVDAKGLKSPMTKPVFGGALAITKRSEVDDVQVQADRVKKFVSLSWNYAEKPEKFLIYRAENDEPLTLYKSVKGSEKKLDDSNLKLNTKYEYRIKAVFGDGSESSFSDKADIIY